MTNENLQIFKKLCDKAQELIFDELETSDGFTYIAACGLEIELARMTPIEQILFIANKIYIKHTSIIDLVIIPQKKISVENKNYFADFVIEEFTVLNSNTSVSKYTLPKPLIIEVDGYDYHKTKQQISNDYNREIDLKTQGYDIIRFTGTQVYNNPKSCIEQIYKYIETELNIKGVIL